MKVDTTTVMKFGGASLKTPESFVNVAEIIAAKKGRVVVVVSAMGSMTDSLMGLAHQISKKPPRRELDMLISVGERMSMSLLAMALDEKGVSAISLTGSQSGIITCSEHADALIKDVRPTRIQKHLLEEKVVIVAGFQGVSENKEITTLGRGGSDTSAVALAASLRAEKVEFYKDVKGVYSTNPKKDPKAILKKTLSFDEALNFEEFVIHPRSILLASKNGLPLHVLTYKKEQWKEFPGTWIAPDAALKGPYYESSR
jgi:aspartate kinase